MSVMNMDYDQGTLGDFSLLVNDAITKILCYLDVDDLLCLERTCRYMKLLVSRREVWHSALLRLSPESAPSVLPFDTRADADFRALAISAVRGFRNWTSTGPVVTRRAGPFRLPASPVRLRHVPGTNERYLIEFRNTSFHCFDVEHNKAVVDYKLECSEFLGYGIELQPGRAGRRRTGIRVALTVLYADMVIAFEVVDVDLELGKAERLYELKTTWQALCGATDADFLMLQDADLERNKLFISFRGETGNIGGLNGTRGGIIIDWKQNSVIIASLKAATTDLSDITSPACMANNNLVYLTGRSNTDPTIHAVPLQQILANATSGDMESPWVKHEVDPYAGTHYVMSDRWTEHTFSMGVCVHQPTWLDLERMQQATPSAISTTLLDVAVYWDASPPAAPDPVRRFLPRAQSARFFKLQLLEVREPDGRSSWRFEPEPGVEPAARAPCGRNQSIDMQVPTRHGRMMSYYHLSRLEREEAPEGSRDTEEAEATLALTFVDGKTRSAPLMHLHGKKIVIALMDEYSGALFLTSDASLNTSTVPGTGARSEKEAEVVIEYYY